MVVPSQGSPMRPKKAKKGNDGALVVPTIDMTLERPRKGELIAKACEEYGIFKVVNHGVSIDVINRLEKHGLGFFAKPPWEKQQYEGERPFGYGCRNIGFNGDMGELEYLILHAHDLNVDEKSTSISNDPASSFSSAANNYVRAIKSLATDLLHLITDALQVHDKRTLSNLINDPQTDSILRLNHYPQSNNDWLSNGGGGERIGFGEHTDPQILTVLRSNNVDGLQVCVGGGEWVGVPADPSGFYVMVGDALQALTNGRFVSVRHRATANSTPKPRLSTVYFAGPPLSAWITPLPETISTQNPSQYLPFTWEDYKNAAYGSRLGDCRLNFFKRK
ncbi:hypothetical protein Drorol1_Dr00003765 [Drosera rotundifolia]